MKRVMYSHGRTKTMLAGPAIEEIWNGLDLTLADVLVAPRYVNHGRRTSDLARCPEGVKTAELLAA
jgi:hypothetical protein